MRKRKKVYISIVFIVLIFFWLGWTNFSIKTRNIEIENSKIPDNFDGFKIAHISDLHNRNWGDKLIKKIDEENPDIVAITGDLIDSSKSNFDLALEFIEKANRIAPIYYVTGNHEAWIEEDYSILKEKLEHANVNIMDDRSLLIEKEKDKIQLSGIQDPDFVERIHSKYIQGEIVRIKTSEILNKDCFNIVLSHRPEHFQHYVDVEADLVLTGHAHGGQVRIPFIGGLVAPNQGFFPDYTEGVYSENNTAMVVSRGLGNSIVAIRINNTPELVMIELKTK